MAECLRHPGEGTPLVFGSFSRRDRVTATLEAGEGRGQGWLRIFLHSLFGIGEGRPGCRLLWGEFAGT